MLRMLWKTGRAKELTQRGRQALAKQLREGRTCREIMEALKSKAPFWKKETLVEGDRWVENNTPGV